MLFAAVMGTTVSAQIATDLVEKRKADFPPAGHRRGHEARGRHAAARLGLQPARRCHDRQITFYVDGGTPLYGKLFFPKGFKASDRRPAVVVGHGINALSIGIEKYGARFAERGLVAMAIDYQSYGFSGSGSDDLKLLEADPTTDAQVVADKRLRVVVKRTNLNNAHESRRLPRGHLVPARRAWRGSGWHRPLGLEQRRQRRHRRRGHRCTREGCRLSGCHSAAGAARPGAGPHRRPGGDGGRRDQAGAHGQGAEVDGGFSFKSKIDLFGNFRNRDIRPGSTLDQIAETTKILFLPAERDELTGGPAGAQEATRYLNGRGVDGADHRLSGADALSGVLEHRLRRRLDPRGRVVPEVSESASRREAGDGCAGAE
jgi:hypothetical protein